MIIPVRVYRDAGPYHWLINLIKKLFLYVSTIIHPIAISGRSIPSFWTANNEFALKSKKSKSPFYTGGPCYSRLWYSQFWLFAVFFLFHKFGIRGFFPWLFAVFNWSIHMLEILIKISEESLEYSRFLIKISKKNYVTMLNSLETFVKLKILRFKNWKWPKVHDSYKH